MEPSATLVNEFFPGDQLSRKYSEEQLRELNPGHRDADKTLLRHVPDCVTAAPPATDPAPPADPPAPVAAAPAAPAAAAAAAAPAKAGGDLPPSAVAANAAGIVNTPAGSISVDEILGGISNQQLASGAAAAPAEKKKVSLTIERSPSPPPLSDSEPDFANMTPAEKSAATLTEIQAALIDADSPRYGQAVSRVQGALLKLITENGLELNNEVVGQVAGIVYKSVISVSRPAVLADVVKETLTATKQIAPKWGQNLHAAILDRCQQAFERRARVANDDSPAVQVEKHGFFGLIGFLGELFNRSLLSDQILNFCIAELLGLPRRQGEVVAITPSDKDLESVAILFHTCGKMLEKRLNEYVVVAFFDRLCHFQQIATSPALKEALLQPLQARKLGWPNAPSIPPTPSGSQASPTNAAAVSAAAAAAAAARERPRPANVVTASPPSPPQSPPAASGAAKTAPLMPPQQPPSHRIPSPQAAGAAAVSAPGGLSSPNGAASIHSMPLPSPHQAGGLPNSASHQSLPSPSYPSSLPSPSHISAGLGSHQLQQLQQSLLQQQQPTPPAPKEDAAAAAAAAAAADEAKARDDDKAAHKLNVSAPAFVPGMSSAAAAPIPAINPIALAGLPLGLPGIPPCINPQMMAQLGVPGVPGMGGVPPMMMAQQPPARQEPDALEASKDRTVYVVGIDTSLPEKTLLDFVQSCGRLLKIRLCGDTNNRTIYGFFEYKTRREAQHMMDKDKTPLGKYILNCSWAKSAIRDAMTGSAHSKVRNYRFDYEDESSETELRESCLQQRNWMPRNRKREQGQGQSGSDYDPMEDEPSIADTLNRGDRNANEGPPVLVKKRSSPVNRNDEHLSTASLLLRKLQSNNSYVVETAETLMASLGNDSTKDVQNVRRILGRATEEDLQPLDVAIRAVFLSLLSADCVRRSIPTRVLEACNKAARISAYKCLSEALREFVEAEAWEICPDLWSCVADCIAEVVFTPSPLLQPSSLRDLFTPLSKVENWSRFRQQLEASLTRGGVDSQQLNNLLP